jgi:hypothetical protein
VAGAVGGAGMRMTGDSLAAKLLEAHGIDPHMVKRVVIDLGYNEIAVMHIDYYLGKEETERVLMQYASRLLVKRLPWWRRIAYRISSVRSMANKELRKEKVK